MVSIYTANYGPELVYHGRYRPPRVNLTAVCRRVASSDSHSARVAGQGRRDRSRPAGWPAGIGEVFDAVGAHRQVIVLTCSPTRYDGVKGAHRIELTG
jgi:hypothetical protein